MAELAQVWEKFPTVRAPRVRSGVFTQPGQDQLASGRPCVYLGVDIGIVAEALGHESLESTKIYTQVSFKRTRQIAELFGFPGVE